MKGQKNKKPSVEPSASQAALMKKRKPFIYLVIPRGIEPLLPA